MKNSAARRYSQIDQVRTLLQVCLTQEKNMNQLKRTQVIPQCGIHSECDFLKFQLFQAARLCTLVGFFRRIIASKSDTISIWFSVSLSDESRTLIETYLVNLLESHLGKQRLMFI